MANKRPLFHTAHYNILAAQIKDQLERSYRVQGRLTKKTDRMGAVVSLAIGLAKRLKQDNENFDPLIWLDACSPDPDLYPLSELWEENAV